MKIGAISKAGCFVFFNQLSRREIVFFQCILISSHFVLQALLDFLWAQANPSRQSKYYNVATYSFPSHEFLSFLLSFTRHSACGFVFICLLSRETGRACEFLSLLPYLTRKYGENLPKTLELQAHYLPWLKSSKSPGHNDLKHKISYPTYWHSASF